MSFPALKNGSENLLLEGRHPLYQADISCSDNLEYLESINEEMMDLIVTSPPYNLGKSYEKRISLDHYINQQRQVIEQCVRTLNRHGSLCWQVGNYIDSEVVPLDTILYPIFKDLGLKLRNCIIWHFGYGLHCRRRFSGRYETILWWTKGDDYIFNLDPIRVPSKYPNKKHFKGPKKGQLSSHPLGKNPSDIWAIPNVKNNHPVKTIHPCQFPVELVERLVLSMTNPGGRVLDPYMGVGSTVITATKNHRRGYGCDNERIYVDIARQRLKELAAGRLKTRPLGKPIYTPPTLFMRLPTDTGSVDL